MSVATPSPLERVGERIERMFEQDYPLLGTPIATMRLEDCSYELTALMLRYTTYS